VELNGREVRLPPDPALGIDHYSYQPVEKGDRHPRCRLPLSVF
jgi:hypothetical protein